MGAMSTATPLESNSLIVEGQEKLHERREEIKETEPPTAPQQYEAAKQDFEYFMRLITLAQEYS